MDASILTGIGGVIQDWQSLGKLGGLIALINLLVNLTKQPWIDKFINPRWRPWIAMGLGSLGGAITAFASSHSVLNAIMTGLMVGLGATGVHETWNTLKPSETAKRAAAAAVSDAMAGPESEVQTKVAALKQQLDTLSTMSDKTARLKALADLLNKK